MMSLVRAQLGEPKKYSLSAVGVDDAEGPPVPIPNTEVKLSGAENSALATGCDWRRGVKIGRCQHKIVSIFYLMKLTVLVGFFY